MEAMEDTGNSTAVAARLLRYSLARNLCLFERTGQRAFVWRVWRDARRLSLPMPMEVLAIIDQWAREPVSAYDAERIGNAERNLDVIEQLRIRQHDLEPAQTPNQAARSVAEDMHLSFGNVKVIKSRWASNADTEDGALT